ncbi:MAG: DUF1311 domain-containing protein [Achromobacter sp.]|jgi:uncharacterized protein YecT (DUF1311 family)|uniref:Lysozyme inhibitor LprI-like N-terminal domain-containing protein n=1 Tax=Achromobacter insuavis TaxID=1287735 RepID=A0A6J4ZTX8_9BURK|nr:MULTISPECIES: lysozyme inhibitor LprI family protein [Achromobacter]MBN9637697.1 DUF1311 domain-containing protein [Achromobacter sp.]MCG2599202.1 lysozyme inhibitor LprI family protein [Achromobacter sp.]MCG2601896.1 lysozyme inhibitor LprI family protein [Achromobacter sp.]CAB3633591.1 hypothetical protein LMG26845_01253 [Achromobacter insuavis]CAB3903952.1 hypothetical protein LMG26846_04654 [Achromobacter insuavis]
MIRHALALSLLLSPALALGASTPDYMGQYDRCLRDAGVTNNGTVGACAEGVSAAAKREINALYARIQARLASDFPQDAAKLEQTQKAWLVYRNGQCDLAGAHVGSPMYEYCPMLLNISRAAELRELAGD